jgi:uncharacterized membrane protein
MAKESSARSGADKRKGGKKLSSPRRRKVPNWPVLALALLGMVLAGYLTSLAWVEGKALFCGTGSACDIVQSSRWAVALGVPVALWGFLGYAALALIAYRMRNAEWHWKLSWILALLGTAVSLYLTAVSMLEIGATCIYCLASAALMAALLVIVWRQKPEEIPEFRWPSWLLQTGGVAVVLVVALHLYYSGVFERAPAPEDPYLKGLAIHLKTSGAKFFGASWCPVCNRQKELFGSSAERLPYVECTPGGQGTPLAPQCQLNGVQSFPTWLVGGQRNVGFLPVADLARLSGYVGPVGSP